MADQTNLSAGLLEYIRRTSLREDTVLSDLREETRKYPLGYAMQIMPEEGQFLSLLVKLINAKDILEIGTFTGYSTLCLARSISEGGRVTTCDISDKWPQIAIPYWRRAGVCDRIELIIGDGRQTLPTLLADKGEATFDLIFIDADKGSYPEYYEYSLKLLRRGGLMVLDNTLFFGRVADAAQQDPDTVSIRALNAQLLTDERIDLSLVPMADGMTFIRKK